MDLLNQELNHLIDYSKKHWTGFDEFNSDGFFNQLWSDAIKATNKEFRSDPFTNLVESLIPLHEKHDPVLVNGKIKSDEIGIQLLISSMMIDKYIKETNPQYSKTLSKLMINLKKDFPGCVKIKPADWDKIKSDEKLQESLPLVNEKSLNKEFKGMYSGTAACASFPARISIQYTLHDYDNQIRPFETFVGAALGQAFAVSENINVQEIKKDLKSLLKDIKSHIKTQHNVEFYFSNPIGQLIFDFALLRADNPNINIKNTINQLIVDFEKQATNSKPKIS